MTPRDFTGDFYEDDEPVDEIVAAFESGKIELTAPDLGLSLVGATLNRGLVFTGPSLPPESFERMVTLTISAKHAWRICGYLSVWEANDDWTRDAYEEFRAALEAEQ